MLCALSVKFIALIYANSSFMLGNISHKILFTLSPDNLEVLVKCSLLLSPTRGGGISLFYSS